MSACGNGIHAALEDARLLSREAETAGRYANAAERASAGVKSAEELSASTREIKVTGSAAVAAADAHRAQQQVDAVLNEVAWQAVCDALDNKLPRSRQDVAGYLTAKARDYGIKLIAGDASALASKVLGVLNSKDGKPQVLSTCEKLRLSGL